MDPKRTSKFRPARAAIGDVLNDAYSFDDVVEAWSDVLGSDLPASAEKPSVSDAELDEALRAIADRNANDTTDRHLRSLVAAFPYPTFIVSGSGRIIRMNEAASARFGALPDDPFDQIGFLANDGRLPSQFLPTRHNRSNAARDVQLVGAQHPVDETKITLAIVPTNLQGTQMSSCLVFVVEDAFRKDTEALVRSSYGLTETETRVLGTFLEGSNLSEIAEKSQKSVKTVRTQFHAILAKLGVRSQADLVRKVMSISHFMQTLAPIAQVASHPDRRRFDMIRPGRRSAEVFLAGDMDGELVVVVPSVTMRTFPATMEDKFRARGLTVATLCRPGYGGSDPPANGQSSRACYAEDFRSLLGQLGVTQAKILAQNSGSGYAVGLACDVPQMVSEVVLASAMPPAPFLTVASSNSKLSAAFIKARRTSPKLFRLLMHLSIRAWKLGGVRRVHGRQMAPFAPDLEFLGHSDIMEEFDAGMRSRFAQDLDMIGEDFERSVSDWSDDLRACTVPVSILHGVHDQAVAIDDIRRLCAEFPDLIALTEVENAGFMLPYSHTDIFLSALQ